MKTRTVKIILTILMAIFTITTCSQVVLANSWNINAIPVEDGNMEQLKDVAGRVLGLIRAASGIAAVVLIAVFGFKFILGSANEKADYQKSFIPLIVGVVVVFASASIADLIFGTFTNEG